MKAELARRQSNTDAVLAFLKAHPSVWIEARDFEQFGRQAWRTRISEARSIVEDEGGVIENRITYRDRKPVLSEYRYLPHIPLARDAATPISQRGLF